MELELGFDDSELGTFNFFKQGFTLLNEPKEKKGVLLIDIPSLIFSIIFRLRGRYLQLKESFEEQEKQLKINEKNYILKYFSKNFCETVNALVEKYRTKDLVFARDDSRERVWRVKKFPKYKCNRKKFTRHKQENVELGHVFSAIYQTQYEKLTKKLNAIAVKVPKAEADDIIAVLTKFFSNQSKRVVIVANDFDYYQLMIYKGVEIYDNRGTSFLEKAEYIPPTQFSQFKILRGDKSDNIPSCQVLVDEYELRVIDEMNLIGKKILSFIDVNLLLKMNKLRRKSVSVKMAKELQKNPEKFWILLDKDPLFLETFRRNSELIDMNKIPQEIVTEILSSYSMALAKYIQSLHMNINISPVINLDMNINMNQQVTVIVAAAE